MFKRNKKEKENNVELPVPKGRQRQSYIPKVADAEASAGKSPRKTAITTSVSDDDTVIQSNSSAPPQTVSSNELRKRLAHLEEKWAGEKTKVVKEKEAKRKLYSSLVKLAQELKRTKEETRPLIEAADYANQAWYEGGMWRPPRILPSVGQNSPRATLRETMDLSEVFFNLVIVTAFTRVGSVLSGGGKISLDFIFYFAVIWMIWSKNISYTTRFDSTDLSYQLTTLLTCFATLFGSLSMSSPINSNGGTRVMIMACFVVFLHLFLHLRLAIFYINAPDGSIEACARGYANFTSFMTLCEASVWLAGILLPDSVVQRWLIFVVALVFSLRLQGAFLPFDFHATCAKRGVLFVLVLGFQLQSIMTVAIPFFDFETPTLENYTFMGACCLLFFCLKLLYVDDSPAQTDDHALVVNKVAATFFSLGQFILLVSTTVLGAGLVLLTHSYLAAAAALSYNSKVLVCGGFASVIFAIFLMKSMHLRRVPTDWNHKWMFVGAYLSQTAVMLVVIIICVLLALGQTYLTILSRNQITLISSLTVMGFVLVIMSWLDEAIELALYKDAEDSKQYLIQPFGFCWTLGTPMEEEEEDDDDEEEVFYDEAGATQSSDKSGDLSKFSSLTPLLGSAVVNMDMSDKDYGSTIKAFEGVEV